jgi:hypothetical protein
MLSSESFLNQKTADLVSSLAEGCAIADTAQAAVAEARQWCESESRKGKPMEATERGDSEKGALRAKLEAAIEKTKAACERLEEKTVEAAKATDKAIRQHPYESIGIAFGVGLLIGVLVVRYRHD